MSTISASTTSTTAYKVTADTTGTLVFQTGATPTTALTIGSDQSVTFAGTPTYSGGTANGVLYLNGSKAITSGSALVFDGTNLGVGVTPSTTIFSGSKMMQVGYSGNVLQGITGANFSLAQGAFFNSAGNWQSVGSGFRNTLYSQTDGSHIFYNAAVTSAGSTVSFTQAMTLDASGNLGLNGTAPAGVKLYISDPDPIIRLQANTASGVHYSKIQFYTPSGTNVGEIGLSPYGGAATLYQNVAAGWNYNWQINSTAAMTLDSSGRLLVGAASFPNYGTLNSYTNSAAPAARFVGGPSTSDGTIALMVDKYSGTNTTSQWFLGFTISNQTTASGVITANGASQAAFGSWSDRRLKENIVDLPPQLDNIMALRPVEFDYIESEGGGHQISFIAQEFEKVYPDAIGERSDGMKTLTGWSKTEARLVKAIQELKAELDTAKAQIAALQGAAQ